MLAGATRNPALSKKLSAIGQCARPTASSARSRYLD